METQTKPVNVLTLKWGTIMTWQFDSETAKTLLNEYHEIGSEISAIEQHDTPRQKEIICELVDECDGDTIYLEWNGKDVSKEDAKKYVMEYGNKTD